VDGVAYLRAEPRPAAGSLVRARVIEALDYDFVTEALQ